MLLSLIAQGVCVGGGRAKFIGGLVKEGSDALAYNSKHNISKTCSYKSFRHLRVARLRLPLLFPRFLSFLPSFFDLESKFFLFVYVEQFRSP